MLCKTTLGRVVFSRKQLRIFLGFSSTLFVSILLLLTDPFWVLVVSPLVLGPVHLWASFRYTTPAENLKSSLHLLACFVAFSGFYFLRNASAHLAELVSGEEILAAGLVCVFLLSSAHSFRVRKLHSLLMLISVLVIATLLVKMPYQTLVAALFVHNLIAFYFWWLKCNTVPKKNNWMLCLFITGAVCILAFFGLFDTYLAKHEYKPFVLSLASMFKTSSASSLRLVFVFGLTQSLHYFIWLRAIPELSIAGRAPPCWRQSFRFLLRDLGAVGSSIAVCSCLLLAGFLLWSTFVSSAFKAYQLYIAAAGFHGFYEIAQLFSGSRNV